MIMAILNINFFFFAVSENDAFYGVLVPVHVAEVSRTMRGVRLSLVLNSVSSGFIILIVLIVSFV